MREGKAPAAPPAANEPYDSDDEVFQSLHHRGAARPSRGTQGRAPRLMRDAAHAGETARRRLELEDRTTAEAMQAEEYAQAAEDPPEDDQDECPQRPKKKPRPKSAAPPPAPVPSSAHLLAALAELRGGKDLLRRSQEGTPDELAYSSARRSERLLKPPAHQPLAIKNANMSNRGRGGAKVGRDGGISGAAKRKAAGAGQFGTREARKAIKEADKLRAKKTLSKAERAELAKLDATAAAGMHSKANPNVNTKERKGADRRQCPFCAWCCSISAPASGKLTDTAMARHIKQKHADKWEGCKPCGPFLKGLPKEKK